MADRYSNFIVNGNGAKPGFRPIFEKLGCTNIHGLKKEDLLEHALNWDRRNAPLFMDDPEVEHKASQAQKDALIKEVNARKKIREEEAKKGVKKATGKGGQAQKAKTAAPRRGKDKAPAKKEEGTPSDDEAPEQDQDGDVRMAEDEDAAEAAPMVDPTADAVSSPHGGKRKRRTIATAAANKRARTARSKPTEEEKLPQEQDDGAQAKAVPARRTRAKQTRERTHGRIIEETPSPMRGPPVVPSSNQPRPVTQKSLVVKLKGEKLRGRAEVVTGRMQPMTQVSETDNDENMALADDNAEGPSDHQTQTQTAGNMQKANTRQTLKQPASRLQQGVAPPLELARSMEGNKINLNDAVAAAEKLGDVSGTSASDSAPGKLSSRRQSPRINKNKANVPATSEVPAVDDASDETDESTFSEAGTTALSSSARNTMPVRRGRSAMGNRLAAHSTGEELDPDEPSQADKANADANWPKDEYGRDMIFEWNHKIVLPS